MTSDTARSFDLGPYQVTVQVFCGDAARFGSKADVCDATCNVRFAIQTGIVVQHLGSFAHHLHGERCTVVAMPYTSGECCGCSDQGSITGSLKVAESPFQQASAGRGPGGASRWQDVAIEDFGQLEPLTRRCAVSHFAGTPFGVADRLYRG